MDKLVLMFSNIGASEIISIGLGVLSLVLGIISIVMAIQYRKIDDKINRITNELQSFEQDKIDYIYVVCREIKKSIGEHKELDFGKDSLCVLITSKYDKKNRQKVLEKIEHICPDILKKTYIQRLIREMNTNDSVGRTIHLTLRNHYNEEDLREIKKINKEFKDLGLRFEYTGDR